MQTITSAVAHLDGEPVVIRTSDVHRVQWSDIPVAFRVHAHGLRNILPVGHRGQWLTLGEYAVRGDYVSVVALRIAGRVEYAHLIDDPMTGCPCGA